MQRGRNLARRTAVTHRYKAGERPQARISAQSFSGKGEAHDPDPDVGARQDV